MLNYCISVQPRHNHERSWLCSVKPTSSRNSFCPASDTNTSARVSVVYGLRALVITSTKLSAIRTSARSEYYERSCFFLVMSSSLRDYYERSSLNYELSYSVRVVGLCWYLTYFKTLNSFHHFPQDTKTFIPSSPFNSWPRAPSSPWFWSSIITNPC